MNQPAEINANEEKLSAQDAFLELVDEYYESRPNFKPIEDILSKIDKEFSNYGNDFEIILDELPEHGGGIEQNAERITNMKKALVELDASIEFAASVIAQNTDYAAFANQVRAARAAYAKLHIAIATL